MLAAFAASHFSFDAQGRGRGYGTQIIDLDMARHGGQTLGAHGLAHGLVEQGGDDAAVQAAGMAFEGMRDDCEADHAAIRGVQEFQAQPRGIGLAAAKTAIRRRVGRMSHP